jgi:hypothetical protein
MSQCLTGKTIGELSTLSGLSGNTLFIVEQDGITYHIPFSAFGINSENCLTDTLTYSGMTGKTSTNSLKPGCFYMITDADPALYGGTNIVLQAISTNKLSLQGHGIFYTPPYDQSTPGFRIWTTGGTYSIGNVAYWGGYVWENLTGSVGTSTDIYNLDNTNWSAKTYNYSGYNISVDIIHYDYDNNLIIYRKDKLNNEVSFDYGSLEIFYGDIGPEYNPIRSFQWGNYDPSTYLKGVKENLVINSLLECINFRGRAIVVNKLSSLSIISGSIYEGTTIVYGNNLEIGSSISNNIFYDSNISYLSLINFGSIITNFLSGSTLFRNSLYRSNILNNVITDSFISNNKLSFSEININTMVSDSYITNNILNDVSVIQNNDLDSGLIESNTLTNSEISFNDLNNGSITNNILTKPKMPLD